MREILLSRSTGSSPSNRAIIRIMKDINRLFSLVVLAGVLLCLTGCMKTWHDPMLMVPNVEDLKLTKTRNSIAIGNIEAGTVLTDPNWLGKESHITPGQFRKALMESFVRSGMFVIVTEGGDADFLLNAELISQKLETGFTQTQKLFVHYSLIDRTENNEVWDSSYLTQFDATLEEWGSLGRLKAANEGAVRKNITKLLQALSEYFDSRKAR